MNNLFKINSIITILSILFCFKSFGCYGLCCEGNKSILLSNNAPIQDQLTLDNKKYIIKDNFNLNGSILRIPANCTLKFNGGSINNGLIVFDKTTIDGNKTSGIFNDINVSGSIIGDCYAKWFSGDGVLIKLFNIVDHKIILEKDNLYLLDENLIFKKSNIELIGNQSVILFNSDGIRLSVNSKDNIVIKDIIIDGNKRTNTGIALYKCNNTTIQSVTIKNISWDDNNERTYCYGIDLSACINTLIDRCIIEDVKGTQSSNVAAGIAFNISGLGEINKDIIIQNSSFRRIWSEKNGVGLGADCIVLSGRYTEEKAINARIMNCTFADFSKRAVKAQAANITICDCSISFSSFMNDKESPNYAIEIFGSNSIVANNTMDFKNKKCGTGICVYGQGKALRKGENSFFDDKEVVQNVVITGNVIEADYMDYGLLIGQPIDSESNIYKHITISNNRIVGRKSLYYGIRAMDSLDYCEISGNIIENANTGIWMNVFQKKLRIDSDIITYNTSYSNIDVVNNSISCNLDNKQFGIYFDSINEVRIIGNTIDGFTNGISLGVSSNNKTVYNCTIKSNQLRESVKGIETGPQCVKVMIVNNYFSGNKEVDMDLKKGGFDFVIKGNTTSRKVIDFTQHSN